MQTTGTIQKVSATSIPLPKTLYPSWRGKHVFIDYAGDTITIKRLEEPTIKEVRKGLKKMAKRIPQRVINDAVQWARQGLKRELQRA